MRTKLNIHLYKKTLTDLPKEKEIVYIYTMSVCNEKLASIIC